MSNLEKYIKNLTEYFNNQSSFTETEKIMYVYLDLGKSFKFDQDFYFGGSKLRKRIYDHSSFNDYLEECFDKKTIICKSSARICQHIFSSLGIKCLVQTDDYDLRKYKHVYNIIVPSDGSESYSIDLQNDIENIKFHAFPKNFGISLFDEKSYVIPVQEQKEIHKKLGYVSKSHPYMDEYIYLFKQDLGSLTTFNEKIDLILQNIDPEELYGINYWERRWKHEKFISNLLPADEIEHKLHTLEVYKEENNQKKFYNAYFIMEKNRPTIYMYSEKDYKYNKLSLKDFAKLIKNGFISIQGVPGLNREINKLEENEK